MNKEKLKQIIKNIMEIDSELVRLKRFDNDSSGFSKDMILDCATRIYNSDSINTKKEESKQQPATEAQLKELNRLAIDIPENITKLEAMGLISEVKGNYKQGKYKSKSFNDIKKEVIY